MSEYLFFCAIQSGYFTCGTPSPREYELVTNMSNEVDLNDEIMEHSFTLIFEMSCIYNLPKKIEHAKVISHFCVRSSLYKNFNEAYFKCNCKSHNLNT